MNITQIEANIQNLIENLSPETFIYDFLIAYGTPKATIALIKKGKRNLAKKEGQLILKNKLFFEETKDQDLHILINELKNDPQTLKHKPTFIIVTDYKMLLAHDIKADDYLETDIQKLDKYFDFFLPLAGMKKAQTQNENLADIRAAYKMGKLYDEILKENPEMAKEKAHELNVFLSRLLFCFYAEDTDIFPKGIFTRFVESHTQKNGSDLNTYLERLFDVLNTEHRTDYPDYLLQFPYVNGGLFAVKIASPKFSAMAWKLITECGGLDWSEINPDIFGSMMQAVVDSEKRGGLGMHYTSVPNIMKVIEPLFLDELYEELEKSTDNINKLESLLRRISSIKIFDPACGSGNFLIIAYKELRILEMEIIQHIQAIKGVQLKLLSNIKLSQFYGIEIDDFAHEIAKLSLWLAEHQMNKKFKELFGITKPMLPLQESGKIVHANATRIDWETVCPKKQAPTSLKEAVNKAIIENLPIVKSSAHARPENNEEIYILGNPPYLGTRNQKKEHKDDISVLLSKFKNYKTLDYIACWFYKAAQYITNTKNSFSFVSTNSICQGDQVGVLWPLILNNNLEIAFVHKSFKWTNNAKKNAGVTVIVIGIKNADSIKFKTIFSDNVANKVQNINCYLVQGRNLIVNRLASPLGNKPKMIKGSIPADGGHLLLNEKEYQELSNDLAIKPFIKKFIGAQEMIDGVKRWCLYIKDDDIEKIKNHPEIIKRLKGVEEMRLESTKIPTIKLAKTPYKFAEDRYINSPSLVIPCTTSGNRDYIPISFQEAGPVIYASAQAIYNAEPYIFGIVTSRMHMIWVRTVAGRLKTDYRYSSSLCYNTFPFPKITERQKHTITHHVFNVLDEREKHTEKTMAEMYDPNLMPEGLKQAHKDLDTIIELCYRSKPFTSNEERLEYLFNLYENMIKAEHKGE